MGEKLSVFFSPKFLLNLNFEKSEKKGEKIIIARNVRKIG